jgi:hypothetical protein
MKGKIAKLKSKLLIKSKIGVYRQICDSRVLVIKTEYEILTELGLCKAYLFILFILMSSAKQVQVLLRRNN